MVVTPVGIVKDDDPATTFALCPGSLSGERETSSKYPLT
jgi:hypothetical protein